jgi:hypothetical protein
MFEIEITDGSTEIVADADSYVLEGPLTTFFVGDGRSGKLSAFSTRVASFRTDRIVSVRRVEGPRLVAVAGA